MGLGRRPGYRHWLQTAEASQQARLAPLVRSRLRKGLDASSSRRTEEHNEWTRLNDRSQFERDQTCLPMTQGGPYVRFWSSGQPKNDRPAWPSRLSRFRSLLLMVV
jgi:hypothetical protein